MTRQITPEMVAALNTLLLFAERNRRCTSVGGVKEASEAIDVLDNADFFTPITDARDELENATPRTPVAIEKIGPLYQARDAGGRIWSTATTYAKVTEHLGELDTLFIVVSHDRLGTPLLDPAEWGDTTREDIARRHGVTESEVNWNAGQQNP